eukprot:g2648.t1
MEFERALLTPRLHYGGWILGVLLVGVGIVLPFLYMAMRDKHMKGPGGISKRTPGPARGRAGGLGPGADRDVKEGIIMPQAAGGSPRRSQAPPEQEKESRTSPAEERRTPYPAKEPKAKTTKMKVGRPALLDHEDVVVHLGKGNSKVVNTEVLPTARHNYLPPLRTHKQLILDSNDRPVLLKGANWATHGKLGTEPFLKYMPMAAVLDQFVAWDLNSVRLNYSLDQIFADSHSHKRGRGRRASAGARNGDDYDYDCNRNLLICQSERELLEALRENLWLYRECTAEDEAEDVPQPSLSFLQGAEGANEEEEHLQADQQHAAAAPAPLDEISASKKTNYVGAAPDRNALQKAGTMSLVEDLMKIQPDNSMVAEQPWSSDARLEHGFSLPVMKHRPQQPTTSSRIRARDDQRRGRDKSSARDDVDIKAPRTPKRSLPLCLLDAMVREITRRKLFVILNNHMSDAGWCCDYADGNQLWFTERYPTGLFLEHISFLAARYRDNKYVVGIDLRNEIRPRLQSLLTHSIFKGKVEPYWNSKPRVVRRIDVGTTTKSKGTTTKSKRAAMKTGINITAGVLGDDVDGLMSSGGTTPGAGGEKQKSDFEFVEPAFFSKELDWAPVAEACAIRMEKAGARHMLVIVGGLFQQLEFPRKSVEFYNLHGRFPGRVVYSVHDYDFVRYPYSFAREDLAGAPHASSRNLNGKRTRTATSAWSRLRSYVWGSRMNPARGQSVLKYVPSYAEWRENTEQMWGFLTRDYPVWIGEFGYDLRANVNADDSVFFLYLQRYVAEKRLGYCWWQTAPVREAKFYRYLDMNVGWSDETFGLMEKKRQKIKQITSGGPPSTSSSSSNSTSYITYTYATPGAENMLRRLQEILPTPTFEQFAHVDEETWMREGLGVDVTAPSGGRNAARPGVDLHQNRDYHPALIDDAHDFVIGRNDTVTAAPTPSTSCGAAMNPAYATCLAEIHKLGFNDDPLQLQTAADRAIAAALRQLERSTRILGAWSFFSNNVTEVLRELRTTAHDDLDQHQHDGRAAIPVSELEIIRGRLSRYDMLVEFQEPDFGPAQQHTHCACRDMPETISLFTNAFDRFFRGEASSSSSLSSASEFFGCTTGDEDTTTTSEMDDSQSSDLQRAAVSERPPTATTCEPFEILQETACLLARWGGGSRQEGGREAAVHAASSTSTRILANRLERRLERSRDCFDHTPFGGVAGPSGEEMRQAILSGTWSELGPAYRHSFARPECVVRNLPRTYVVVADKEDTTSMTTSTKRIELLFEQRRGAAGADRREDPHGSGHPSSSDGVPMWLAHCADSYGEYRKVLGREVPRHQSGVKNKNEDSGEAPLPRALFVRVTQPATENMWHALHLFAPLAVELAQGHFDYLILDCIANDGTVPKTKNVEKITKAVWLDEIEGPETCFAAGSQWGVEHVTFFGRDKGAWRGLKTAFVNKVNRAWEKDPLVLEDRGALDLESNLQTLLPGATLGAMHGDEQGASGLEFPVHLNPSGEPLPPQCALFYLSRGIQMRIFSSEDDGGFPRVSGIDITKSNTSKSALRITLALRFGDSRRVENLQAVLEHLCHRLRRELEGSFVSVSVFATDLSQYDLPSQHAVVRDSLLVGPHGQALSWLPFAHKQLGAIELMPFMGGLRAELCRAGWNQTPMYAYGGMGLVFDVPHLCLLGKPRSEGERTASLGTELNHWIRRGVLVDEEALAEAVAGQIRGAAAFEESWSSPSAAATGNFGKNGKGNEGSRHPVMFGSVEALDE